MCVPILWLIQYKYKLPNFSYKANIVPILRLACPMEFHFRPLRLRLIPLHYLLVHKSKIN